MPQALCILRLHVGELKKKMIPYIEFVEFQQRASVEDKYKILARCRCVTAEHSVQLALVIYSYDHTLMNLELDRVEGLVGPGVPRGQKAGLVGELGGDTDQSLGFMHLLS